MSHEPPEWEGRGPHDRSGWPTSQRPTVRGHRRADGDPSPQYLRDAYADTGEIRPSREPIPPEMPTDPGLRIPPVYEPGGPVVAPPYARPQMRAGGTRIEPHFTLARERDPIERFWLWLRVFLGVLAAIALMGALWCLGLVISHSGVPVWVPRS